MERKPEVILNSDWRDKYKSKLISAGEAARLVKSNDRVMFGIGSTPIDIGFAIAKRASELRNVTVGGTWSVEFPWFKPGMEESFNVITGFGGQISRNGIREKRVDWLSWLPGLDNPERCTDTNRGRYYNGCDIYLVNVSPPDKEGYCDLGHQPFFSPSAIKTAKTVIAEITMDLPRTFGPRIPVSDLDYLVEAPRELDPDMQPVVPSPPSQDEFEKLQVIGALVAELIRDGDCLQIGTGTASEAVIPFLKTKNDLGIDTEILPASALDPIRAGNVTGSRKNINKGKVLMTVVVLWHGDPRTKPGIEFIDLNPVFEFHDFAELCSIPRIATNDNMVAVDNLLAIDLLGQGVLDHLGPVPISGPGGGVEYAIASHYSKGGRSISCLPSTAGRGKYSRIVSQLERGSVVQLPMGYIDYLVTEYGVVNLEHKTRRERAEAIISVAHPDFRPDLKKAARELFYP